MVLAAVPVLFLFLMLAYTRDDIGQIKMSVAWILLGASFLVLAVYGDKKVVDESILRIIEVLSGTFISLGVINIVLQFKDAKEYFATALSELISQESYIAKLNQDQLKLLEKRCRDTSMTQANSKKKEVFIATMVSTCRNTSERLIAKTILTIWSSLMPAKRAMK